MVVPTIIAPAYGVVTRYSGTVMVDSGPFFILLTVICVLFVIKRAWDDSKTGDTPKDLVILVVYILWALCHIALIVCVLWACGISIL